MKEQSTENSVFLETPNRSFRFVNIEGLKELRKKIDELKDIENTYPIHHCYKCGDTEPKHGFYPMVSIGAPLATSSIICNRCARTDEDYLKIFKEPKEVF